VEELKDGLQLACIWKADLQQQAKGFCKVHLQDCLIDMQSKRQHKQVAEIKQKCNREESKRMWYLIKRTVKDLHSPSILRVHRVEEGGVKEKTAQEEAKHAIQCKYKISFSLAHSAPFMTTLLGERLSYLSDKALARSIIMGTYKIPSDMEPATKLILEEIGRLGTKLVIGEGNKIIITPKDFKHFWKKVNEFTSSSMLGVYYGRYKAAIQDTSSAKILAQQLTVIA
jgi:hypothetical protein